MTQTPSRRTVIKGFGAGIAGAGILGATGAALAASDGDVVITVYADAVVDGQIQSAPFANVTVADGTWRDHRNRLGRTDENGVLETTLEGGAHSLSVFKMTSSHSTTEKSGIDVTITPGETNYVDIHVAPEQVRLKAHANTEWGKALYVTGQTDYLGNWATATRLSPPRGVDYWSFYGNLPLGAEFKIVQADWADDRTIPTSDVTWEEGPNHTIEETYGYYETVVDVYPTF